MIKIATLDIGIFAVVFLVFFFAGFLQERAAGHWDRLIQWFKSK